MRVRAAQSIPRQRRAISLIETLAAMFVLGLAGVAILNLFATSHEVRNEASIRLAATMRSEDALARFMAASDSTRAELLRNGDALDKQDANLPEGTNTSFVTNEETLTLGSAQTRVRVLRIRATVADRFGTTMAALERLEPMVEAGTP